MPKKTIDKKDEIKEKLDYLGIDLENVKEQINEFEDYQNFMTKNNIGNIDLYQ